MTNTSSTITLTQNDLIFLHSPLNMLAQFVLLFQERFSQGNLPWVYDVDENKTGMFIYTEYNEPTETSNVYPRLIVGRGSFVHRHAIAVGDLADPQPHIIKREGYYHWSLCEADIQIQCVSEQRGEASVLGDIVQATLGMSRKEICKQFTLRNLSDIQFLPTQPHKRDQDKWESNLRFRVEFEHRWFTLPSAPLLREVAVSTKHYSKNQLDALDYVKNFVLRIGDLP